MRRRILTLLALLCPLLLLRLPGHGYAAPISVIYLVSKHGVSIEGPNTLNAIDLQSGTVLHRIPESARADLPNLVVAPSNERLWWLEDLGSNSSIKLIRTEPWAIQRFAPVRDVARYIIYGPPRMVFAGSRLFVYERYAPSQNLERFWLIALNPSTLKSVGSRIPMPGCGIATLAAVPGHLVLVCERSRDVRIVDTRSLHVTRLHLPRTSYDPVGGAFVPSGSSLVYVVDRGLGIAVVDPARRRITQTERPAGFGGPALPAVYGAALLSDGRTLVAGGMEDARLPESAFSLRIVDLRTLKITRTIALPRYVHLAPSPDGGLLTFPMGDSTDQTWQLTWMSADLSQTRQVASLDGPVFAITSDG